MNTISVRAAAASVIGARHVRTSRNGQDAAAAWTDPSGAAGAIVVCDGCSSGASSEVGARLGAQLVLAAIADALRAGESVEALWDGVRARVVESLARLVDALPGPRETAVHDHLLFTVVAAAWRSGVDADVSGIDNVTTNGAPGRVAVWALGDGGYALGDRTTVLGPFADNQPPYLGYDLLGAPAEAHLEVVDGSCGSVVVATDGVVELLELVEEGGAVSGVGNVTTGRTSMSMTRTSMGASAAATPTAAGLVAFAHERFLANPDALRRHLAVCARSDERVDWERRKMERRAAALQDDGAVAVLRWRVA